VSTIIRGGEVVGPQGARRSDVLIEDGVIVAVDDVSSSDAHEVIDAGGMLVLPGCVDMHTHLEAPHADLESNAAEQFTCDDFRAGTLAAAVGGTTTIVDFATQSRGVGFHAALDEWQQKLVDRPPAIDVGLHMIVTDMDVPDAEAELAAMCERGVTSYKLFLAYKESDLWVDDGTLLRVAQVAHESGALVLVHAENGGAIEVMQRQALAAGHTEAIYHALTRPPLTEAEAISRSIDLCEVAGAPVYFMHISCREALEVLRRARSAGRPVFAETCPQYLAFTEDVLRREPAEAAKYLVTPPPRPEGHADDLWGALRDGTLELVSTDHCPYTSAQKAAAKDFFETPNGAPGIENRLEVMFELGVRQGELELPRLVELLATRPAQLFGLAPRKGEISPGADADIVIFDPDSPRTIRAAEQMSLSDYSLYEGMEVQGSVRDVICRGERIVRDRSFVGRPDGGRFVERERFSTPSAAAALGAG
jgi:dihydropyrimidinase